MEGNSRDNEVRIDANPLERLQSCPDFVCDTMHISARYYLVFSNRFMLFSGKNNPKPIHLLEAQSIGNSRNPTRR